MAVPWTLNDRHQTMHCDMIPGGAVLPSSKQSLPLMNTLQRLNDGQVSWHQLDGHRQEVSRVERSVFLPLHEDSMNLPVGITWSSTQT